MATVLRSSFSTRAAIAVPSFLKVGGDVAQKAVVTPMFEVVSGALQPPKVPVKVQSRYGLPGALDPLTNTLLPKYLSDPKDGFPARLIAKVAEGNREGPEVAHESDDVGEWARALKPHLDEMLPKHGVVIIEGMSAMVQTPEIFNRFMENIKDIYDCRNFMEGRSMTSTSVANLVRTGSDDHPSYTIEPHNEYNVAAALRPRKLFLSCSIEPTDGGEWVISDSADILKRLPKHVVEKFKKLGARYEVFYPSQAEGVYNHWQGNIAPTREAAEAYLARSGCEWTWDYNGIEGSLLIHRVLPALVPHPDEPDGPLLWFNQIHAHHRTFYQDCHPDFEGQTKGPWPVDTKYGDGSEIEDETISYIREAVWAASVSVPMKLGNLVVVDNYRALHGRLGFEPGTPRQSLVSIIYA
jgi:hypothetical protein